MLNVKGAVANAIEYVRELVEPGQDITFMDVQTHFSNANPNHAMEALAWIGEGTQHEREVYDLMKRMQGIHTGIRLFEDFWRNYDVGSLTLRQREIFGRLVASEHSWLRRELGAGVEIELFGSGPQRGYIYLVKKQDRIIKQTSRREDPAVVRNVGELGIGPRVFEANEDYIVEERVEADRDATRDLFCDPGELGSEGGRILRNLHGSGIVYGDVFFSNIPLQVHLLATAKGKKVIDFGEASWSGEVDLDIRKFIVTLENLAGRGSTPYTVAALGAFSEEYGIKVERKNYPEMISQLFT
jgi:tRNA A-37 threonylcarbamoyl transferase component Bud32